MPIGVYKRKIKEGYVQPRCPVCGSLTIQARITKGDMWCRRCGKISKRKDFFKEK